MHVVERVEAWSAFIGYSAAFSNRSPSPPDADGFERLDGNLSEDISQNEDGHEREEGRSDGHDRTHDQLLPKPLKGPAPAPARA